MNEPIFLSSQSPVEDNKNSLQQPEEFTYLIRVRIIDKQQKRNWIEDTEVSAKNTHEAGLIARYCMSKIWNRKKYLFEITSISLRNKLIVPNDKIIIPGV